MKASLADNITGLTNTEYFRLRVGNYRIIFEKREKELVVLVARIGHRSQVYDR